MLFLVVDDDELSRELLIVLLEAEGHQVEAVASGEEALEQIQARIRKTHVAHDVILTDLQMPGIAGDPLAQAMRSLADSVLLAMSGSDPLPAILSNFDGFLLKPFTIVQLRATLAAVHTDEQQTSSVTPAANKPDASLNPLSQEIFEKLSDMMPALQLRQMYDMCIADARTRIAHMHRLVADSNDAEYRREAHAVKGSSGMIGMSELYALSSDAERQGLRTAGGTSTVTATLDQMSHACDRLERILVERSRPS